MKKYSIIIFASLILLINTGCEDDETVYSPKPKGYPRINFPEKKYKIYEDDCPYLFEIPLYSEMKKDNHKGAEPCWHNLNFNQFKATLHLSYKSINGNLASYLEDSHEFAKRHQIKATGLDEVVILRDSAKVYGLLFDIAGNTASSLQFYLTDSTHHFLRGALYFNTIPNIDSLKVVVDFLKEDVMHLINSTQWKKTN